MIETIIDLFAFHFSCNIDVLRRGGKWITGEEEGEEMQFLEEDKTITGTSNPADCINRFT